MAMLTMEQIIDAMDLATETVAMPEWGGEVRIQALTKGQQQDIRKASTVDGNIDDGLLELNMVAAAMIEPVFDAEHVNQLRSKSAESVDRLLTAIVLLSSAEKGAVDSARREFQGELGSVVSVPVGGADATTGVVDAEDDALD